ncbi:proenkephalin-B [Callorhinchus milii]|nr:proenkephalin-B [Callorhinchus milii]|eukprot:gi/632939400/ref/XP_007909909.1/ PREDICTED: proenkephalin-B isoform X2 [Callorhinchus milii]
MMQWNVLVLVFTLTSLHTARADCTSQCSVCSSVLDSSIDPLICTLECEGVELSAREWERCEKALHTYKLDILGNDNEAFTIPNAEEKEGESEEALLGKQYGNLLKPYGSFLRKLDKNRLYAKALAQHDTNDKGRVPKKYREYLKKFGERSVPVLEKGSRELTDATEDLSEENGDGPEPQERYGGFTKGFGYKRRAEPGDGENQDVADLQKRYGGFMRRVGRPRFKWDNQKRYGGFLRRHFRVSVRSDDDADAYSEEVSDL